MKFYALQRIGDGASVIHRFPALRARDEFVRDAARPWIPVPARPFAVNASHRRVQRATRAVRAVKWAETFVYQDHF